MKLKKRNWDINFYSLLIGFLLALCLMLAIGAGGSDRSDPGRYQCCAAGGDDSAVFVIDTQTGQTWRLARADNCDYGTPYQRESVRRSITPIIK